METPWLVTARDVVQRVVSDCRTTAVASHVSSADSVPTTINAENERPASVP